MDKTDNHNSWTFLFLCWLIALVATCGSLFFSEVMGFIPCSLCWYQRIFMYPLVLILGTGLLSFDKNIYKHVIPFVAGGWFVALYHNLLHAEIIPESMSPCVDGVPCTARWIEWFGFITIPVLSITAFSIMGVLLFLSFRKQQS